MLISCGCGCSFKRSGLRIHQLWSKNPLCNLKTEVTEPSVTKGTSSSHQAAAEDVEMAVDPHGDLFGDYASAFYPIDDPMDKSDSDLDCDSDPDEDDPDEDEFYAALAEQEKGLEPDRHQIPASVPNPNCGMDEFSQGPALRLRGGAETGLQKEPFIVKFTQGKAAAVYSRTGLDNNAAYAKDLGNLNNPYSPFSSKLEWEIAYWDKMRGPSSTAFTELMSIEGVCRYHHKNNLLMPHCLGKGTSGCFLQEHS
jgi:hypothetical protein